MQTSKQVRFFKPIGASASDSPIPAGTSYSLRASLIGPQVGKTTLLMKFLACSLRRISPTCGLELSHWERDCEEGMIKCIFQDAPSRDFYFSSQKSTLRTCDVCYVFFDLYSLESLDQSLVYLNALSLDTTKTRLHFIANPISLENMDLDLSPLITAKINASLELLGFSAYGYSVINEEDPVSVRQAFLNPIYLQCGIVEAESLETAIREVESITAASKHPGSVSPSVFGCAIV